MAALPLAQSTERRSVLPSMATRGSSLPAAGACVHGANTPPSSLAATPQRSARRYREKGCHAAAARTSGISWPGRGQRPPARASLPHRGSRRRAQSPAGPATDAGALFVCAAPPVLQNAPRALQPTAVPPLCGGIQAAPELDHIEIKPKRPFDDDFEQSLASRPPPPRACLSCPLRVTIAPNWKSLGFAATALNSLWLTRGCV